MATLSNILNTLKFVISLTNNKNIFTTCLIGDVFVTGPMDVVDNFDAATREVSEETTQGREVIYKLKNILQVSQSLMRTVT